MNDGTRKLAAVMFTDIVGYSAISQRDETLALRLLDEHHQLLRPFFERFHLRIYDPLRGNPEFQAIVQQEKEKYEANLKKYAIFH